MLEMCHFVSALYLIAEFSGVFRFRFKSDKGSLWMRYHYRPNNVGLMIPLPTHLAPVPGVMGGQQETSGRLSVWWFIRTAIDATLGIWRFRLPVEYSEEQTPTRL